MRITPAHITGALCALLAAASLAGAGDVRLVDAVKRQD